MAINHHIVSNAGTSKRKASAQPELRLQPGVWRRRWQWSGVLVALLFSGTFGWTLVEGHETGVAFWLAQAGLVAAAGLWWRRLRGPDVSGMTLRYSSGRWWLKTASTTQPWQPLFAKRKRGADAVTLPGVVVLGSGRLWLFPDECSHDDWRRLNLCARFGG